MKVNILSELKAGAWGGGNQFQKALRAEFVKMGVYEDDPDKAEVILFNSFPFRQEYLFHRIAKLKSNGKIVVHRVDGPISEIRGGDLEVDKIIYDFNGLLADGTVFQSEWSRAENYRLGMKMKKLEAVIINAPDNNIFNSAGRASVDGKKVKLIATSWSANHRKGFALYQFLDEHLDFSKYQMSFFGNAPLKFKNISQHAPLPSAALAEELKKHDIFISASQKDPCSNSLIEALSCGLPAVGLNDGGHPEIIGQGGEVFNNEKDVLAMIDKVAGNYESYRALIKVATIEETAQKYFMFIQQVHDRVAESGVQGRRFSRLRYFAMLFSVYFWKLKGFTFGALKKFIKK